MLIVKVQNFNNYIKALTKKTKIVLHGTFGGPNVDGVILTLKQNKHLAVHYIIDGAGKIYQLFDDSYYAFHAGADFRAISKLSIGIEICNWLNLNLKNGKYYTWTKKLIHADEVKITLAWRQNKYWHKVNEEQFSSMCQLLNVLCNKYSIPKRFYRLYNPSIYNDRNFSGILMHSSFHPTRLDFEPNLIPKIIL